jgi:antitoxin VapB
MALYLKDPEVDALARELARIEGKSITETVRDALMERRAEIMADRERRDRKIRALWAEIDREPDLDTRHPDEILYDEDGVPK